MTKTMATMVYFCQNKLHKKCLKDMLSHKLKQNTFYS